jgi:hypothetical protein
MNEADPLTNSADKTGKTGRWGGEILSAEDTLGLKQSRDARSVPYQLRFQTSHYCVFA